MDNDECWCRIREGKEIQWWMQVLDEGREGDSMVDVGAG